MSTKTTKKKVTKKKVRKVSVQKKDFMELAKLKKQVDTLYEKIAEKESEIVEKYGEGQFAYKLKTGFKKFKVMDNSNPFKENGILFRPAKFRQFEVSISEVKNEPKDTTLI